MEHYKHVLLTTDFSPEGMLVAERAKGLATNTNAKLSIVHVVEFNPVVYGAGEFAVPLDPSIEENLQKQARESLAEQAQRLGVGVNDRYLLTGSTKEEIVKLAKEKHIDLIVVGAHNLHGLNLIFGSTANSIMHAMPCDVLAVRLNGEE